MKWRTCRLENERTAFEDAFVCIACDYVVLCPSERKVQADHPAPSYHFQASLA